MGLRVLPVFALPCKLFDFLFIEYAFGGYSETL